MIRIKDIQNAWQHLVGWTDGAYPDITIDEALKASESGLYYNDAHPLVTMQNILSILPDESHVTFPAYDPDVQCIGGKVYAYGGGNYLCRETCTGIAPTDTTKWKAYSQVSEYLARKVSAGIADTVQRFMTERESSNASVKPLVEHKTLFDGAGRRQNAIQNSGKIVGFEIQCLKGLGVTTQIHKVGLQFAGNTSGTFTLYLYHTSRPTPVATKVVSLNAGSSFQWVDVTDFVMPYAGSTNAGGTWYLCYSQNELPSTVATHAINVGADFSKEPCNSCRRYDVQAWRNLMRFVSVSPFMVAEPEDFADDKSMFDPEDVIYTPTCNYGMNVELSVSCDITDFLIEQRQMFAPVLQKVVAGSVLREIQMNPAVNVNRNQLNVSQQELRLDIEGSTYTKSGGIQGDIRQMLKNLTVQTNGMDSVCLPCKRSGVRIGVA